MKFRKLPVLLFLAFSTIVFSQNKKGDWALSASVSPYPTETGGHNDFGFLGLAGLEFFVSDKVSFSGSFFTSDNGTLKNDSDVDIKSYGFIPSTQYYFVNKESYNLFGQIAYGFGFKSDERTPFDNEALRIYSLGAGGQYHINDVLSLQLLLPYFNAKDITLNRDDADGVAVFLGLRFKL